mmetsp:Transcript_47290/g.94276  ORF Transcript_47290/g.94276 Transcript_47290/m.94276 type:complete len:263 (+) Transcript_47290:711-1499(+)
MALYTSATFLLSSSSICSCTATPTCVPARSCSSLLFSSSTLIVAFRCSICDSSPLDSFSMRLRVSVNCVLSSSSAASVSCEFCIRKRFDSSSAVKMSSSCCGSLKYIGTSRSSSGSSSDEISSRLRILAVIPGLAASAASSASRSLRLRRPFLALSAAAASSAAARAASAAAFSSSCRFSSFRCLRAALRPCRSCSCSWKNSGGVSLSRKSLYFRQSSSCSSNLDISDLICVICMLSFLISCTFSAFAFVSASAFLIACTAF